MNVPPPEMKASDLIVELQKLIKQYGDQYVYSGGTDYPEPVSGVSVRNPGDGYVPKGAFYI